GTESSAATSSEAAAGSSASAESGTKNETAASDAETAASAATAGSEAGKAAAEQSKAAVSGESSDTADSTAAETTSSAKSETKKSGTSSGTSLLTDYERDLLAALVFYEANTEPASGKVAVASVVLNRMQSAAYPDTLEGVIYQRSQFTPARRCASMASAKSAPQSCYDAVDAALSGDKPVGNALHFMRRELHSGIVIAHHAFW
ncbi:MAG: cell wall hydrolase, partial [Lachnospiraceae bacterium]|nr:cell wall hydrolase [Lachnospiraceae bacterium]